MVFRTSGCLLWTCCRLCSTSLDNSCLCPVPVECYSKRLPTAVGAERPHIIKALMSCFCMRTLVPSFLSLRAQRAWALR